MKGRVGLAFKITISVALIAFLAWKYGGDDSFRAVLARLDWRLFLAADAVIIFGLALSALRWVVLLAAAGVRLPFLRAMRLYFEGYFFNFFLPTTVGGDVARGLGVRHDVPLAVIGGSILLERLLGFGCLLALGLTASFQNENMAIARGALGLAALAYLSGLAVLIFAPLPRPTGTEWWAKGVNALRKLADQIRGYGFRPGALLGGLVLSLAWQLSLVAANGLLSQGLGGVAPWKGLLALIPVVQAVTMIPVSFGGLGVREMGYEYFFRVSGYDPAGAVALGVAWLALTALVSLKGGAVLLGSSLRKRRN